MIRCLLHTFKQCFRRKPAPKKLLFIGIDYLCFSLSKRLLDNNRKAASPIEIVAFIDDEPWNNRTLVHGTTVYSPSEISALVIKRQVDLIIQIEGESLTIAPNIWRGVLKTNVRVLTLDHRQSLDTMLDKVYEACTVP